MANGVAEGQCQGIDFSKNSPPFNRNASAWSQRIPICILAGFGFLIAAYMGLYQWGLIDDVWDPVFGNGSEKVLDSRVSGVMHKWIGIPDSILGAIAYLGDLIYGLAGSTRRWQFRPWMTLVFGFDVIPLGIVSAILVGLQGAVVGSWCFLCLVSAVISLVLIGFAYDEVWASIKYLYRVKKQNRGNHKVFWTCFWGTATPEAARAVFNDKSKQTNQSQEIA